MRQKIRREGLRLLLLFAIALSALVLVSPPDAHSGSARSGVERAMPEVSVVDAYYLFTKKAAVFVDVRGQSEFADEHIPGAVWLPNAASANAQAGAAWQSSATVVVYGSSNAGDDVLAVSHALQAHGVANVQVLGSGWRDWHFLNLPAEKGGA